VVARYRTGLLVYSIGKVLFNAETVARLFEIEDVAHEFEHGLVFVQGLHGFRCDLGPASWRG
jgi:hypothetical protein